MWLITVSFIIKLKKCKNAIFVYYSIALVSSGTESSHILSI